MTLYTRHFSLLPQITEIGIIVLILQMEECKIWSVVTRVKTRTPYVPQHVGRTYLLFQFYLIRRTNIDEISPHLSLICGIK